MAYLLLVCVCIAVTVGVSVVGGAEFQIVVCVGVQAVLLLTLFRRPTISNLGAFLLLSFLMYGVRPLYMLFESDYELLRGLIGGEVGPSNLVPSLRAVTLGACFVALGHGIAVQMFPPQRHQESQPSGPWPSATVPSLDTLRILLGFQVLSVVYLLLVTGPSVTSLYGARAGAYAYLLPQVFQAGQIYVIVVFVQNYAQFKGQWRSWTLWSLGLFLVFTFLMKDVSMFRGSYITGAVGGFIAAFFAAKGRAPYWILVVPVVFFLPFFRALGEVRYMSSDGAFAYGFEVLASLSLENYWSFFDSNGDMNIFDTFVAGFQSSPDERPYFFALVYCFLHWIPRAFWSGKPEFGMLVDMDFTLGNPYHPGVMGFYFLDGGYAWMLGACLLTGGLLYWLDRVIIQMPAGYLRSALYGVFVINSFYFARGYLHFQFYQYLYMVIPCVMLHYLVGSSARSMRRHALP